VTKLSAKAEAPDNSGASSILVWNGLVTRIRLARGRPAGLEQPSNEPEQDHQRPGSGRQKDEMPRERGHAARPFDGESAGGPTIVYERSPIDNLAESGPSSASQDSTALSTWTMPRDSHSDWTWTSLCFASNETEERSKSPPR